MLILRVYREIYCPFSFSYPFIIFIFMFHLSDFANMIILLVLGESLFLNLHKTDLRISKDWVGDQWVDIEDKPNILSVITDTFCPENIISLSSTIAKDVKSDELDACIEVSISTKLDTVEEGKPNLAALACSDTLPEDMDCVNEKKAPSLEQGSGQGGEHVNSSGDEVHDARGNDEHEHDDDNSGKVDAEVFETSGHNDSRTTEVLMEVTA